MIIGTRGSKLAMWQAQRVKTLLLERNNTLEIEIRIVRTKGDAITDVPLAKIGDEGLFTKAIEDELLSGNIDLGVHSAKDMPTKLADGLVIAAYPEREDRRDALVTKNGVALKRLKKAAVIGTSSLRRKAFLKRIRPDLSFTDLRGNIDTRLEKLNRGGMDGIIMALAALKRMKVDRGFCALEPSEVLPAVGQGAMAIEMRQDDTKRKEVAVIDDTEIRACLEAERALLIHLQGGCQVPVGSFSSINGGKLSVKGSVASLDGSRYIEDSIVGKKEDAAMLGEELARKIMTSGADEILEEIRKSL